MKDRPPDSGPYLALAALACALLALIWLTGALSAALFGEGWTTIPASRLAATALRLPSHLGDPRLAWPAGARHALPGPVGFYFSAALILSLLAALGLGGAQLGKRIDLPKRDGRRRPPSARWAKGRDLRALRVRAPQPGRLTLGRAGRSLLAAEERQSVIVVAPSQSGKTTGLAIPALLEWEGPVLATSTKSDLLLDTLTRRDALGEVMVFDPARVTDVVRSRLTPLQGATSWHGAMRVAHWLCAAANTAGGGLQNADFWYAAAEKLLAPLLFAAASSGRTMSAVVEWLDGGPEASAKQIAKLLGEAEEPAAARAWQATQNREERQRSSIYTTAEMVVAAFTDPRVIEETAGADYTPAALLHGANTLYLCAPSHEQKRLRPLFSMVVQELVAVAFESAAASGRPIDPPLLLVLDEAANIAPIPQLDEIASSGAGQGVQLLSVFQDMAQIRTRYRERAATIVNNHRAKVFGTGISDPETLTYISRVLGTGEYDFRSRTDHQGQRSTTEGETYGDLAPANLVREANPGSALLIYGHLPPTNVRLRPWYRERTLLELQRPQKGTPAREV